MSVLAKLCSLQEAYAHLPVWLSSVVAFCGVSVGQFGAMVSGRNNTGWLIDRYYEAYVLMSML